MLHWLTGVRPFCSVFWGLLSARKALAFPLFCHREQDERIAAGWTWQLSLELKALLLCCAAGREQFCAVGQPCPHLQHSCSLPAAPWTLLHRLDAGAAAQDRVFWGLKAT